MRQQDITRDFPFTGRQPAKRIRAAKRFYEAELGPKRMATRRRVVTPSAPPRRPVLNATPAPSSRTKAKRDLALGGDKLDPHRDKNLEKGPWLTEPHRNRMPRSYERFRPARGKGPY